MGAAASTVAAGPVHVLTDGLEPLVASLRARGFEVVAPVVHDRVVGLGDVESAAEIADGWVDEQSPGHYRAAPDGAGRFAHAAPNVPWKRWLRPGGEVVVRARTVDGATVVDGPRARPTPLAFLGVQSCDLAAIGRLDVVLAHDAAYRARRDRLVIVAVACTSPASTCFCVSAGTGPRPGAGADIVLRELEDGTLLASSHSPIGTELLDGIGPLPTATAEQLGAAEQRIDAGAARQTRHLDGGAIAAAAAAPEHPGWRVVADRCLTCGNCTLLCPTCFCTSIVDSTSLDGTEFERSQRWDSCFALDFSYIHGGSVRTSAASRYRQWYLHKLVTWHDQFGESGCVGCGRCITWCPTGIDITEAIVHD